MLEQEMVAACEDHTEDIIRSMRKVRSFLQ